MSYLLIILILILLLHILGLIASLLFIQKNDFIDIDGYNLHYKKTGQGEKKVILIHGMFANLHCWDKFLKFKDENTEYYSIDLPETGESLSEDKPAPVSNVEEVIYKFAMQLNLNKPVIVGSSLGGLAAYLTAIKYPDYFKKCIVVASPFNARILLLPIYKFSFLAYFLNFLVNPLIICFVHFKVAKSGFSLKQVFIIMSKFRHIKHFKSSFQYTYLIPRVENNHRITTKVENYHFIWGNRDHLIKRSNFDNLIGANQKLDFQEIPEATHHPMESHPVEFAKILKKIIDQ